MHSLLEDLVNISSETGDVAGTKRVFECFHNNLQLLEPQVEWVLPEMSNALHSHLSELPLLWARWSGTQETGLKDIILVSHLDTVYSQDLHKKFSREKLSAHGSGVIDNKGGAVVGLWALEKFLKQNLARKRTVHLIVSPSEEQGSPGFFNFFQKLSQNAEYVLGLEPALPGGHLISSRRGNRFYRGLIRGNSVHTGRDFEKGANPAIGLDQIIVLLQGLRKKHSEVTISLNGIKSFPFSYNMSPSEIEFLLDMRFSDSAKAEALHADLMNGLEKIKFTSPDTSQEGSLRLDLVDNCPAFESVIGEDLERLKTYLEEAEGGKLSFLSSKGASDCCYFSRPGLKVVDGLGPRGRGMHSAEESVELESLERRASALAAFLKDTLHLV